MNYGCQKSYPHPPTRQTGTATLYDPKGRRTHARPHVLPLTERARRELEPWVAKHAGGFVLSSTGGRLPLRQETLSNAFRDLATAMRVAGELSKDIQLGDLRRTVETLLAGARVPMEVRAQSRR